MFPKFTNRCQHCGSLDIMRVTTYEFHYYDGQPRKAIIQVWPTSDDIGMVMASCPELTKQTVCLPTSKDAAVALIDIIRKEKNMA